MTLPSTARRPLFGVVSILFALVLMLGGQILPAEAVGVRDSVPGDHTNRASAGGEPLTGKVDAAETDCMWEGLDDRCETWGPVGGTGAAREMAVSPTGDRIFTWWERIKTITAYDAATGNRLWQAKFDVAESPSGIVIGGLTVSPDGKRVYVAGGDIAADALTQMDRDVTVVAFDAADGREVWRTTLGLPAIDENDRYVSWEVADAVAASPDGRRVYVAGATFLYDRILPGGITQPDLLVAGFDADTGAQAWVTTWGDRYRSMGGTLIAVSPDNRTVYVGGNDGSAALALAFRGYLPAATEEEGDQLWRAHYRGVGQGPQSPVSIDVAPDGSRLYLSIRSAGLTWPGDFDWATVAYDASTGGESWVDRYQGPDDDGPDPPFSRQFPEGSHSPERLVASPAGDKVFVTGTFEAHLVRQEDGQPQVHAATVAYDAVTGDRIWTAHPATLLTATRAILGANHSSPNTQGRSVAVSPDGQYVYVVALSGSLAGALGVPAAPDLPQVTAAYESDTGAQLWIARSQGLEGFQVEASPDEARVFVLGWEGLQAYDALPSESSAGETEVGSS